MDLSATAMGEMYIVSIENQWGIHIGINRLSL